MAKKLDTAGLPLESPAGFISEIMTSGVGRYGDDNKSIELDYEYEDEYLWDADLNRFSAEGKNHPPQLENMDFLTIIFFISRLILYLGGMFANKTHNLFNHGLKTIFGVLNFIPLEEKQSNIVGKYHKRRLIHKLESVSSLPTYVSQEESKLFLQELGVDNSKELNKFIIPSDCENRALVSLQLDHMKRPFVTLYIEGQPVSFLVDSGAALSILKYSDFLKIPNHDSFPRHQEKIEIRDHQKKVIPVLFGVMIPAVVGGRTLSLNLLVCRHSASNVLGMDTLVGRSLMFTHRGGDAFLIIGEIAASKKPTMKMGKRMGLIVLNNTVIPSETAVKIKVTPFIFPMRIEVPEGQFEVEYLHSLEGLEGQTKSVKLNDEGNTWVTIKNTGIIDREISAEEVVAWIYMPREHLNPPPPEEESPESPKAITEKLKDQPLSLENIFSPAEEKISSDETHVVHPNLQKIQDISCFCKLNEDYLMIKGNKFGDTYVPYLCFGGFTRIPTEPGSFSQFSQVGKKIVLVYPKDFSTYEKAVDKYKREHTVAMITNGESRDNLDKMKGISLYHLTGECKDHPFPTHLTPQYISFVLTETKGGIHKYLIQELQTETKLFIFECWIQALWDTDGKQLHFIAHLPSVRATHSGFLENLFGALVAPYYKSLRILEPFVDMANQSYAGAMYLQALGKIANFYGVSVQSRSPQMEAAQIKVNTFIPKCTCMSCLSSRDKATFQMKRVNSENFH